MADDMGFNRRDLDLVIFADQVHRRIGLQGAAATLANRGFIVTILIRVLAQRAYMRLVANLGAARPGIVALFLLVRRRRFGRIARILLGTLQAQHQIDQIFLAQPLQIAPVHARMDSDILRRGKTRNPGVGKYIIDTKAGSKW